MDSFDASSMPRRVDSFAVTPPQPLVLGDVWTMPVIRRKPPAVSAQWRPAAQIHLISPSVRLIRHSNSSRSAQPRRDGTSCPLPCGLPAARVRGTFHRSTAGVAPITEDAVMLQRAKGGVIDQLRSTHRYGWFPRRTAAAPRPRTALLGPLALGNVTNN